jgi:hypothetical protein
MLALVVSVHHSESWWTRGSAEGCDLLVAFSRFDALCINYQDLEERGEQVGRTGQIYSLAWRVVVWRGPASYDSALALTTLKYLGEQIEISEDRWRFRLLQAKEPDWWRQDCKLPYGDAQ